ncbi:hypothetical protein Syun_011664 [Stephania yunnanensis]|uniref:Uncharacterized protein n=1 Tax=Stephania yunnanensis TaxID=152371 RepID=A0AAP0JYQ0_9MAGN
MQHQPPSGLGQAPVTLTERTVPVRPYTLPVEPMTEHLPMSGLRRGPQSPIAISILPASSRVVGDKGSVVMPCAHGDDQGVPQLGVPPGTRHDDGNMCPLNAPIALIQTASPLKSKGHALMGEGTGALNAADKGIEDLHNVDIQLATMMLVPWRLMFESQLNVISMGLESQIEEGGSVIQLQTSVMGMGHTGDFAVGRIRSTTEVEQTHQREDRCSLFNESGGEAGLDDFGMEANDTLQGPQEEGHTQLDAKSQSDDSGESTEIEVGADMDKVITETLEEQFLETQLVDTMPTEPLTGNLIEREVEAIQHRVLVGLPPLGSTNI